MFINSKYKRILKGNFFSYKEFLSVFAKETKKF